jgi:hypothetical protein
VKSNEDLTTRGLRHARLAIDSVAAEQSVRIAKFLLWATALAALAAIYRCRRGRSTEVESSEDLLATSKPFPSHLKPNVARELIELARSEKSEDTDRLMLIAMTRGLRHVRLAIDSVAAEQSVRIGKFLLWATVAAVLAATASAVAAILTWLVPRH